MRRCLVFAGLLLAVLAASCAHRGSSPDPAEVTSAHDDAVLNHVESFYTLLLATRRPDLAGRYATPPQTADFDPLNEGDLAGHVNDLNLMLTDLGKVAPNPRADTLRARITRELAECAPDGALRREPMLWIDILEAAVTAPYSGGSKPGCDQTQRTEERLRKFPEALRGAAVMLRDAPKPDSAAFDARIARLEALLRRDLPARTDACKDGHRLAGFAEADTLAAASLQEFRRSLAPGE
jgi:hypothetical protein